jgi:hypothetical protein
LAGDVCNQIADLGSYFQLSGNFPHGKLSEPEQHEYSANTLPTLGKACFPH